MGRVGCGYRTLGELIYVDPREVKRVARHEYGITRPLGLWDTELQRLARHFGYVMARVEVPSPRPTIAAWLRRVRQDHRKRKASRRYVRYVICTSGHWQGVSVGGDGSVFEAGWVRRRGRILALYVLAKQ